MNPWITTIRFHGLPDSDAVVLCRLAAGTLRVIGLGVALAFCIPNGECIALSRGASRINTRVVAARWRGALWRSCAPILQRLVDNGPPLIQGNVMGQLLMQWMGRRSFNPLRSWLIGELPFVDLPEGMLL
jgi:hypothetical protein